MREIIKVSSSDFSGKEREYVNDCLSRNWLSQGYYVREFEEKFADYVQAKYAMACSSGTAALHLAMLALDVDSNTNVIVPALTYVATANAASYCGVNAKFADILESSWCIDSDDLYLSYRDVIVPVDIYDAVASCKYANCLEIADKSESLLPLGSSTIATYSFYGNKIISCGEGGMVATNDKDLADKIKLYRGQGATIPGKYHHSVIGYNYRMTDMQAAIGLAQLERISQKLAKRREVIDRYRKNLSSNKNITLQGGERASGWVMAVLVSEEADRDNIADTLLSDFQVETRPFFEPLPSLPMYAGEVPPVAAGVARRGLCLPTHERLSIADVDYVCDSLMTTTYALNNWREFNE